MKAERAELAEEQRQIPDGLFAQLRALLPSPVMKRHDAAWPYLVSQPLHTLCRQSENSISSGVGPGHDRQPESPCGLVHDRIPDADGRPVIPNGRPSDLEESLLAPRQVSEKSRAHEEIRAGVVLIGVVGQFVASEMQLASERRKPIHLPPDAEERPSSTMRI
ncbi:MAG TPA: hypothetical protein VKE49_12560 [Myxococcaceae bacterium]|nr:hypothetical protein [Myxococcaceae bacterium]